MKELLAKPGFLGTYATFGADLSYLVAVLFSGLFLYAWYMGMKHRGNTHHNLALWGMVAMLVYFTSYYLVRRLGVLALEGREGFGGPDWVYYNIFRPALIIHILLVSLGILMAVYMIVLGFRTSYKKNGIIILKEDVLKIKKKNFIITLFSTLIFFGLLASIRCRTFRCLLVYAVGFLLIAFIIILEKFIERIFPAGAKRHRVLGATTMVMYLFILLTSSLTYILLYISYPPNLSG